MARPIEFDRERALIAAMQLFWRQGYSATSLKQLLDVMGIGRSSFYAAFGDKRSLFVEALNLFGDRTLHIFESVSKESDPTEAVRLFFECTLFDVPQGRMRLGCMMVNSILELADVDQGLSDLATLKLDEIESAFAQCFASAIKNGSFTSTQKPKQLARFVMTMNQGIRVASRKKGSKAELRDIIDTTIAMLKLAV